MPAQSSDEQFDEIIREAIDRGRAVKCSIEDWQQALRWWIDELQTELAASEESS